MDTKIDISSQDECHVRRIGSMLRWLRKQRNDVQELERSHTADSHGFSSELGYEVMHLCVSNINYMGLLFFFPVMPVLANHIYF